MNLQRLEVNGLKVFIQSDLDKNVVKAIIEQDEYNIEKLSSI